jgi:hypothetical protein
MNGEPKTGLNTISLGRPWCVRRVSAGTTERRIRRIWQEQAVTISTYYPIIYPEEIGKITKILSEMGESKGHVLNVNFSNVGQTSTKTTCWP